MMGFLGGYNSAKSTATLSNDDKVDLDGTGFSAKGFFDYPLFSIIGFRGMVGLEQFNIGNANNAACNNGECTVEINYLTLDLWGRIIFGNTFRPWVGGGFDILFPVSKESSAFEDSSITSTSVFAVGGGFDWMLSDSSFIPFAVEYNMYPSTEDVEANAMAIRIGYGWSL